MISQKSRLCINILVAMASTPPARTVNGQTLSERLQVSLSHLESLMRVLREAGFVRTARGPGGGYCMARDADELSLWEVVQRVDPGLATAPEPNATTAPIAGLEADIHATFAGFLSSRTIGDFAQPQAWSASTPGAVPSGFRLRPQPKSARPLAPNSVFQLSAFAQLRAA